LVIISCGTSLLLAVEPILVLAAKLIVAYFSAVMLLAYFLLQSDAC
jgi:hypothetical protein